MSKLREQMDCYRPGLDDLSDAEFAALAEAFGSDDSVRRDHRAIQAWDAAIAQRMAEVPVPDGLAERLMATVSVADEPVAVEQAEPAPPSRASWHLPWPAWAAAGVTAAAVMLVAGLWLLRGGDSLSGAAVAQAARGWVSDLNQEAWTTASLPDDHRPDPTFRFPARRWQRLSALGDRKAVVYYGELAPDRSAAYLIVIHTHVGSQLPTLPPASPDASTEGLCIGSWKNQDHLYVLVVPGDEALYRRLLRTHGLPIT